MEMINPKEIKTDPSFERLFPIEDKLLQAIEEDMRENKFDLSQPVVLAKWEGQDEFVCLDGHTRVQAAIKAGIDQIPVWEREDFETKDDALECAIKLQCHRRNLPDGQIMYYIGLMDAARIQKRSRTSSTENPVPQSCGKKEGRSASAKEIAEAVGCSPRKVEQLRTVMNHADPDILEAVNKGEMSGNRAYQETHKKRKDAQAVESTSESAPDQRQTELNVADGDRDSEEEAETPQQEVPDTNAEKDDHETEHDASGPVETEESEDLEAVPEISEQAEEEIYISVSIRLAQSEVLEQYGLTAEEAIDHYLEYLKPIDDQDRGAYEKIWANFDDNDNAQEDSTQVNAA